MARYPIYFSITASSDLIMAANIVVACGELYLWNFSIVFVEDWMRANLMESLFRGVKLARFLNFCGGQVRTELVGKYSLGGV